MSAVNSPPQAVRQELERVLRSPSFIRNERLSRFLRFVVEGHLEGRDDELKESLIGIGVFGSPDYDPKQNSIVRTEAGRLRARLAEYYADEGTGDSVVIELPKGGYVPSFRYLEAVRDVNRSKPQPPGTRLWRYAILVALSIAVAAAGLWSVQPKKAPLTIAVLPLDNLNHDPADDYFSDGLTDELIRNLSVIEGLAVRSQTSSFEFKGKPRNLRDAGKQLQADYILEGSVLRGGKQLRIDAQLIRVSDDSPLWSGKFDRELTDVFAIQDEISRNIVNSLRLKIGGRRRYETSVEAYDLYLRAVTLDFRRRVPLYEQAVAKDPAFAPAWAGLASSYASYSNQFDGTHDRSDELSKMRAAAERAIQLDPLLAEAHQALADSYARDGQWKLAEQSFRRALDLDPNRSAVRSDFALWLLWTLGRNQEALEQYELALKSDPLSDGIRRDMGLTLIQLGRYQEAAKTCSNLAKKSVVKRECLARASLGVGKASEAIEILAPQGVEPTNAMLQGFLGYAYARSGQRERAEKMAADARLPNPRALIFAGLGDKDRTFEALDQMFAMAGAQRVGRFLSYPELALLKNDPRLAPFRKKIGLPE